MWEALRDEKLKTFYAQVQFYFFVLMLQPIAFVMAGSG